MKSTKELAERCSCIIAFSNPALHSIMIACLVAITCTAGSCTPVFAQPAETNCAAQEANPRAGRPACTEVNLGQIIVGAMITATYVATGGDYTSEVIPNCDPDKGTLASHDVSIPTNKDGVEKTLKTGGDVSAGFKEVLDLKHTTELSQTVKGDPDPYIFHAPAIPACHKFDYKWKLGKCNLLVTFVADICNGDNQAGGGTASYYWNNHEYPITTAIALNKVDLVQGSVRRCTIAECCEN